MPSFVWEVKFCRRCERHLALDLFARDRSKKDGFGYQCRECAGAAAMRYAAAHKDEVVAKNRRYRETHKEERNGRRRAIPLITAERVRELLTYIPESGIFYNRDGAPVGVIRSDGYVD